MEDEDEEMMRNDRDPWDAEGLENRWKTSSTTTSTGKAPSNKGEPFDSSSGVRAPVPARRLQDLSLGSGSSHHGASHQLQKLDQQQKSSSWPFEASESSPCRWSGAKNTRQTAEAREINQKLFDPDFASSVAGGKTTMGAGSSDHMDVEEDVGDKEFKAGQPDADASSSDEMESESFGEAGEETSKYKQDEDEEETSSAYSFGGEADEDEDEDDEDEDEDGDFAQKKSRKTFPASHDKRRSSGSSSSARATNSTVATTSSSTSSRRVSSSRAQDGRASASSDRVISSYTSGLAWNAGSSSSSHHHHPPPDAHMSKLSRRGSASGTRRGGASSARDELSSSCHAQVESHTNKLGRASGSSSSSSGLRRRGDELSSTTFHGPVSQSRVGPSQSSSGGIGGPSGAPSSSSTSRRAPLGRTKSSDGAEMGLGAATLHGGTSVSRIRGGKRRPPTSSSDGSSAHREGCGDVATGSNLKDKSGNGASSSKPPGERRLLQRAMSIRTVKRPEEYAMAHKPQPDDVAAVKKASDTSTLERSRRVPDGMAASTHGGASRPSSSRSGYNAAKCGQRSGAAPDELAASSAHHRSSSSSSSRHAPHRSTSMQVLSKPSRSQSQQESSRILHRSGSGDSMSTSSTVSASASATSRRQSKAKTPSPSPPSSGAQAPPAAPRRDLLVLLRDKKKVSENDMMEQDNRRLLHYLMLEHKMGVKQREIFDLIRRERQPQGQQPHQTMTA